MWQVTSLWTCAANVFSGFTAFSRCCSFVKPQRHVPLTADLPVHLLSGLSHCFETWAGCENSAQKYELGRSWKFSQNIRKSDTWLLGIQTEHSLKRTNDVFSEGTESRHFFYKRCILLRAALNSDIAYTFSSDCEAVGDMSGDKWIRYFPVASGLFHY